jgi:hypothetical protein
MSLDAKRRVVLTRIVAAAVAAATPVSFARAATRQGKGPIPERTLLELADGNRIEIVARDGALVGRVLDPKGRVLGSAPAGNVRLKSGKMLTFDRAGRLTQGRIATHAFLLECDPPPAKCPP